MESSGIHTNGYTLVRKIMKDCPGIMEEKIEGRTFIDAVLEPHRCYYTTIKELFGKDLIQGMAHITGGGICENLNRILPDTLDAEIDLSLYKIPEVFSVLRKYGSISDEEMLRTFNLGVGLAMVVKKDVVEDVMNSIRENGVNCNIVGEIIPGSGKVLCKNKMIWE